MKKQYSLTEAIDSVNRLKEELGHEPTVQEIDKCDYTPTARTIQRNWGGIKEFRREAGMKILNHTVGKTRVTAAEKAYQRAKSYEKEIHNQLVKRYHNPAEGVRVSRQFAWQQWIPDEEGGYYSDTRADSAISDDNKNHVDIFDFFYPQDTLSLGSCFRDKKRKYLKNPVYLLDDATNKVYFVCVNENISQADIDSIELQRQGIKILSLDTFHAKFIG